MADARYDFHRGIDYFDAEDRYAGVFWKANWSVLQ